jgi:small subunit ribosomal protein S20
VNTVANRHKSALKAERQNVKRRAHNRELRGKLRTALKGMRAALDGGDKAGLKGSMQSTVSLIDKMATKGIIHANTAGRYKSRLTKRLAKTSATA